jgi:hypothetical protein
MAPTASITMKAMPNWRWPSSRKSTIGSSRVSSHGTKNMNEQAAIVAKVTIVVEWNQSSIWPRSSTISRLPKVSAISANPTQSILRPPARRSRRSRSSTSGSTTSHCTSTSEMMPIGTLMKKIQCQE